MSEVKVNKISPRSGTTVTLGDSGDTITLASGVSLTGVNATFSGDLTVDTNTLYVDSTNNRVGIGTSSPLEKLHVNGNTAIFSSGVTFYYNSDATNSFFVGGNTGASGAGNAILRFQETGVGERMRIDSSGNVLVGKTGTSNQSNGFALIPNGASNIVRDGGACMQFNRKTTDGDILQFVKDATTVGSIGSNSTKLQFLSDGEAQIGAYGTPTVRVSSATMRPEANGSYSLGTSSYRWNNLYLGGSVYLGGTGSANALDDYETGTWTPGLKLYSGTPTTSEAFYTKVGRLVTVSGKIILDGTNDGSDFTVTGLPFTPLSTTTSVFGGYITYTTSSVSPMTLLFSNSVNEFTIYTGSSNVTYNSFGVSSQIRFVVIYYV